MSPHRPAGSPQWQAIQQVLDLMTMFGGDAKAKALLTELHSATEHNEKLIEEIKSLISTASDLERREKALAESERLLEANRAEFKKHFTACQDTLNSMVGISKKFIVEVVH